MYTGTLVRMRYFSQEARIVAATSKKYSDAERFGEPQPQVLNSDSIKLCHDEYNFIHRFPDVRFSRGRNWRGPILVGPSS